MTCVHFIIQGTATEKGMECPTKNWAWQFQGPHLFAAASSGFGNSTNNASSSSSSSASSTAVPFLTYHHYNPSIRSGTGEYYFRS